MHTRFNSHISAIREDCIFKILATVHNNYSLLLNTNVLTFKALSQILCRLKQAAGSKEAVIDCSSPMKILLLQGRVKISVAATSY